MKLRLAALALLLPLAACSSGTATEPVGTTSAPAPASASSATPISMSEVGKHATAADCWAAVNGNVYDLTAWIAEHPGGKEPIEGLCGTDGTEAFAAQHGGQGQPENKLESFLIGPLG